jgi:hypothetical protein
VTLRQLRRKRQYAADGTDVELSLDEVDVVDRGRIVGASPSSRSSSWQATRRRSSCSEAASGGRPGALDRLG